MTSPMPLLLRADARALPLPDECVDLIVTSPPYFGLRDYGVDGQIGAEATPSEFLAALVAATREMVRVLKRSGSIFVNLGDRYAVRWASERPEGRAGFGGGAGRRRKGANRTGIPEKSLMLLPERYRTTCVDELGLIARAVLIWSKSNVLPESVTDRVRRSHEDWVHLTRSPRYYSAVDELREPHTAKTLTHRGGGLAHGLGANHYTPETRAAHRNGWGSGEAKIRRPDPLGRVPGSVWEIATEPLTVPPELGVDHFATFPTTWPRRLILGWSPREVCTACGEGRRPITTVEREPGWVRGTVGSGGQRNPGEKVGQQVTNRALHTITGYACACPDTSSQAAPGTVFDPFGGTGTTALTAVMLGRRGISVDLSPAYQRIARWRASDPHERARAAGLDAAAIARIDRPAPGQGSLLDLLGDNS